MTVALALLSLALATLLGALGAAGRLGGGPLARGAVLAYTTIVRGVPDLVLLLLVYFGGQRLANTVAGGPRRWRRSTSRRSSPGVLAIGFIYGAYLTETFRGAYMAIPARPDRRRPGARPAPASRCSGPSPLPQLVRFALPGYANVWQVLVKSTAVVSVIGLQDLVGLANDAGKTVRQPFVFFAAVLGVYLVITWASTAALRAAGARAPPGARPCALTWSSPTGRSSPQASGSRCSSPSSRSRSAS